VELELDARPSPWLTLSADWTFTDARYRQLITEDGDTLSGARVFNTAKYVGVASVEVAPPDQHWQVRLATNVVGPYSPFDAPGVVDPAYALFHLSAGLRIAGVGLLEVGIRNLFDRAYPELRAGDFVTPGQPRALFATLRAGL
jgi:outer membrane receptor protein involved in Fe transport